VEKNQAFLQKHRNKLASLLEDASDDGTGEIVTKVDLDDDLMIAFNRAGGHSNAQLTILQLQSNRSLKQLIDLLTPRTVEETNAADDEPVIEVRPEDKTETDDTES